MLAYAGLPGYFGMNGEESELTLQFWYILQEALWTTDFYQDGANAIADDVSDPSQGPDGTVAPTRPSPQVEVTKAVYRELVQVLRRKVAFSPSGNGWSKGELFFPLQVTLF